MRRLKGKGSLLTAAYLRLFIFFCIIITAGSCHHPRNEKLASVESFGKIIYDNYIINRDTTDSWGNECLSNFNRKALIEKVFKAVFDGRVTPLDYFTGEKLTVYQIRKMETEGVFSRENISKIQFEERWIWDNEKFEMQKQIISMTIAYEVYDNAGKSRGQKPIFKLVFRK